MTLLMVMIRPKLIIHISLSPTGWLAANLQVNCGIGRDSVEAWGRKKRSVASGVKQEGKQVGDDMTLSREILVLDLKEKEPAAANDELNNSAEPSGAQKSPLRSAEGAQEVDRLASRHCLSSQSLFVLICSVGCFFVLYVCVVAYFFARRHPKVSPIKHQFH